MKDVPILKSQFLSTVFVVLFLALATTVLTIATQSGFLGWARRRIASDTRGLSFINSVAPEMFAGRSKSIVLSATKVMGVGHDLEWNSNLGDTTSIGQPTRRIRLDIVITCLLMSSILYSRVNEKVINAAQVAATDPRKANKLLQEAEHRIQAQGETRFAGKEKRVS